MAGKPYRPLSPHLQIYRLPLTAVLSISHRITGVCLSVGLIVLAAGLVIVGTGGETFPPLAGALASAPGQVMLWLWIFALTFHACHGVRHLLWDVEIGLARRQQTLFNLLELASAVGLTVALWLIGHSGGAHV